jgi:hypothetical protein
MMAEQVLARTAPARSGVMERYQATESYEEPMYAPRKDSAPQMRPTFVGQQERQTFAEASRYQSQQRSSENTLKHTQPRKFTRYTTAEQTQAPQKEAEQKEEKETLRWR